MTSFLPGLFSAQVGNFFPFTKYSSKENTPQQLIRSRKQSSEALFTLNSPDFAEICSSERQSWNLSASIQAGEVEKFSSQLSYEFIFLFICPASPDPMTPTIACELARSQEIKLLEGQSPSHVTLRCYFFLK